MWIVLFVNTFRNKKPTKFKVIMILTWNDMSSVSSNLYEDIHHSYMKS